MGFGHQLPITRKVTGFDVRHSFEEQLPEHSIFCRIKSREMLGEKDREPTATHAMHHEAQQIRSSTIPFRDDLSEQLGVGRTIKRADFPARSFIRKGTDHDRYYFIFAVFQKQFQRPRSHCGGWLGCRAFGEQHGVVPIVAEGFLAGPGSALDEKRGVAGNGGGEVLGNPTFGGAGHA